MLNRQRCLIIALSWFTSSFAAHAEPVVNTVFAALNTQATEHCLQMKRRKGPHRDASTVQLLKADVKNLSPDQLIQLIKQCKQKIHEIPSDSVHECYFDYFEQAIKFSIRRLGELNTSEARKALSDVKPIIADSEALVLTWNEINTKKSSK